MSYIDNFFLNNYSHFLPVFDDAGEGGTGEGGTGEGGTGEGGTRTFTQDEVNQMLDQERKKSEKRNSDLLTQLESLKTNKNLTEEEKTKLETQIQNLKSEVETRDKMTEKEKQRLENQYKKQLSDKDSEVQTWQKRFQDQRINADIVNAVAKDAFNPSQLLNMLRPNAQLAEVMNDKGEPTGDYETRINWVVDGKPVSLKVDQVVEYMQNNPEEYGNLFKSSLKGGLGGEGNRQVGNLKPEDIAKMSPKEYREKFRSQIYNSK